MTRDADGIDFSELEEACQTVPFLHKPKNDPFIVRDGVLYLGACYMPDWPNPFDSYYDSQTAEFHIIIQRDAFPFSSIGMDFKFSLPEGTKKICVDYKGRDTSNLSFREKMEKYFPNARFSDEEEDNP